MGRFHLANSNFENYLRLHYKDSAPNGAQSLSRERGIDLIQGEPKSQTEVCAIREDRNYGNTKENYRCGRR